MTELKTLKDIEFTFPCGVPVDVGGKPMTYSKYLRDEAIKWIKYYRERSKRHDLPVFERPICKRVADVFETFFNITEEDLK